MISGIVRRTSDNSSRKIQRKFKSRSAPCRWGHDLCGSDLRITGEDLAEAEEFAKTLSFEDVTRVSWWSSPVWLILTGRS